MLRITPQRISSRLTFKLEGRLAGPYVAEVAECWRTAVADGERHIWIDLTGVCQVDIAGRFLLGQMHRAGVGFVTEGCEMRELLREVSGEPGTWGAGDQGIGGSGDRQFAGSADRGIGQSEVSAERVGSSTARSRGIADWWVG